MLPVALGDEKIQDAIIVVVCFWIKIFGRDKLNPVLMLSKRLTNQNGNDPQYLSALVDFRFIDALLKENNIEDTGEVYLVNEEGLFLSTSRFGVKALQNKIPIQEIPLNSKLSAHQAIDYRGETVLQSRQNIPPFNWIVVADQDGDA